MNEDYRCCEKCEYDLTGLPQRGRCPECGHYYSLVSGEGVRRVDLAQRKLDRLLARMRTIGLALAGVAVFTLALLLALARQQTGAAGGSLADSSLVWSGAFIALIFVIGAITSYVYEDRE